MYFNESLSKKMCVKNFNSNIVSRAFLLFVIVSFVLVQTSEQAIISRRLQRAISAESTTNVNNVKPPCHGRTPCGWAVYKPFTRRFDYYMENTCDCPSGKVCLRTDDDLSVSAYVYTCRADTSVEKGGDNEAAPPS